MYRTYGKRYLDALLAAMGLVLLSPVILAVSVAIAIDSPGGIMFSQERVGRYGRIFAMFKFRSMVPNASQMGKGHYFDGENDPRITKVGRFLRKSSLDELPELWNVLKGDMSLVGPRPMLPYQYDHLSAEQKRRFEVRPGITGLAQVSGRNVIPWSKRIILDVQYIDSLCLTSDLHILFRTVTAALSGSGVDHSMSAGEVEDFIYNKEGETK